MGKGAQEASSHAGDPAAVAMVAAWALWDGGDKVAARRAAEQVLQGAPPCDVAADARDLLARLKTPWQAYGYGLLAALVICGLILIAVSRT